MLNEKTNPQVPPLTTKVTFNDSNYEPKSAARKLKIFKPITTQKISKHYDMRDIV